MKRFFSAAGTYIRMGYLLHLVTIVEIAMIAIVFAYWHGDWNMLRTSLLCVAVIAPIFPQLDARSRFQNYKLVKDQLNQFGYKERIVKPFTKSRCQRDAVMMACRKLGHTTACAGYFDRLGYRWYHLFPDVIVKNPLILFNWNFIKTTFFVKTYQPRFNYRKENIPQQNASGRRGMVTIRKITKEVLADLKS